MRRLTYRPARLASGILAALILATMAPAGAAASTTTAIGGTVYNTHIYVVHYTTVRYHNAWGTVSLDLTNNTQHGINVGLGDPNNNYDQYSSTITWPNWTLGLDYFRSPQTGSTNWSPGSFTMIARMNGDCNLWEKGPGGCDVSWGGNLTY